MTPENIHLKRRTVITGRSFHVQQHVQEIGIGMATASLLPQGVAAMSRWRPAAVEA
jgi:hypothetical protein